MKTPEWLDPQDVPNAVRLEAVSKRFGRGDAEVTALHEVNLRIPRGTFTAVMGPSGSGKSTLLHCAAGLDRPTSGAVFLGSTGTDLTTMSESKLTLLRRREIGFVFQAFNLLPALTVRRTSRCRCDWPASAPTDADSLRSCTGSDWRSGPGTGRPSCPAGSNSESRSRAP